MTSNATIYGSIRRRPVLSMIRSKRTSQHSFSLARINSS